LTTPRMSSDLYQPPGPPADWNGRAATATAAVSAMAATGLSHLLLARVTVRCPVCPPSRAPASTRVGHTGDWTMRQSRDVVFEPRLAQPRV
jgi:hypothetical protein